MKHKGSISHVYVERDKKAVLEVFRQAKNCAEYPITVTGLLHLTAEMPTKKYYIADDAAYEYCRKRIFLHFRPQFKSNYKQKLYDAMFKEVNKMRHFECYKALSLRKIVALALDKPAPCIGLTPRVIGEMLRKAGIILWEKYA